LALATGGASGATQEAAEAHLLACLDAWHCENGECDKHDPDDPAIGRCEYPPLAGAWFCPCLTCEIREVLAIGIATYLETST